MPNPVHLRHIGRNNDILNVCSLLWEAFPMMSQWGSQPPHLCGSFHTQISNSWTSGGCPRIQLKSDTISLETESDSTGQLLSSTGTTST